MAGRGAERNWMSLDEIDRDMVRAAIGGEDSKYCTHSGFDWDAIQRAYEQTLKQGKVVAGGGGE